MSEDLEQVMSRSINSDKSWNSTDEEYEECDNSSPNDSSIGRRISGEDIPGACITTHSVSSVIRPGCKMPKVDPLQFVKIKNNDLSKKVSHPYLYLPYLSSNYWKTCYSFQLFPIISNTFVSFDITINFWFSPILCI